MPGAGKSTSGRGWPLLIHQIPPRPNYFRVKIWRRLQRLGAVWTKADSIIQFDDLTAAPK